MQLHLGSNFRMDFMSYVRREGCWGDLTSNLLLVGMNGEEDEIVVHRATLSWPFMSLT